MPAFALAAVAWAKALPSWLKWLAVGIAGSIAIVTVALIGVHVHDASVIKASDDKRAAATIPATNRAAEDRAQDAINNAIQTQDDELAIAKAEASEAAKPPEERATIAPTTVALGCQRLRRAYSAAELAKMQVYQEKCQ